MIAVRTRRVRPLPADSQFVEGVFKGLPRLPFGCSASPSLASGASGG